jgi:MazG family protein
VAIVTVPQGDVFDDALLGQELVSLKRIVDVLRVECPWDREQTARDIISYTIEEVYELADAVAGDDLAAEHGELGDLLLQVVLLALMLRERDAGDLGSVAHDIEVKLIRRHPHIFADAVAETAADVKGRWERIKVEQEGREGIFHDVPSTFHALLYARKLQQRAASVGFDWSSATEAFPKIAEEHGELAELFAEAGARTDDPPDGDGLPAGEARHADPARRDPRVRHELGDLLFAVVNVARLLHVDPELALREAAQRFERRVNVAAAIAQAEGVDWAGVDLAEQEQYYQRAKAQEELQ